MSYQKNISSLLEKTTDYDKDERYMATSDLCHTLKEDQWLGAALEKQCCEAILKQLNDKSNDVQSIAVKCLGILVTKVEEAQVADICEKLCELILHGKPELRDIYSIGLKTILGDVTQKTGASIASSICVRLLAGLKLDSEQAVKAEALDILTDLLRRFGYEVSNEHAVLMDMLVMQLADPSSLVRKRTTACVGSFGVIASDALVSQLIEHLLQAIQSPTEDMNVRTLIQTIGTLSRTAGHRLGNQLSTIIPILIQFCGDPDDESMQNEASHEVRENCFQAFDSFVMRCHREITPHLDAILKLSMQFIKYDPNYNYGDSDDEDEVMEDEEDEYSEEEDEGDYSDDDDTSWKVRRASLRVLMAIITTRPELLDTLYSMCCQPLISRFKEREESVRVDVFTVFTELLRAARQPKASTSACRKQLHLKVNAIVEAANKQLGPKQPVSSRCAVVAMLSELALVEKGQLGEYIDLLMPSVARALEDKHSDLKLDALVLMRLLVDTHAEKDYEKHVDTIISLAIQCVDSDWYKTVSRGLALIEALTPKLRTGCSDSTHGKHAPAMFDAVQSKLAVNDIDQEIKECAISSMGQVLSIFGDVLGDRVNQVYPILMERLNNDITRVYAMKAIAIIAQSPLNLDMSSILPSATHALTQLLRQQSRSLKQCALDALNAILMHKGSSISCSLLCDVLTEGSTLIVDSDLQLCKLAIVVVGNVVKVSPSVVSEQAHTEKVVPKALAVSQSPMLQGKALDALMDFLAQLTQLNTPPCDFDYLFRFLTTVPAELPKHAMINTGRCITSICLASTEEKRQMAFSKFMTEVTNPTCEKNKVLALYCLGTLGERWSFSNFPNVEPMILESFGSSSDEVRSAAAFALGSICVGNMSEYLETIVTKLEQGEEKISYLLLSSLREVIADHAASSKRDFSPYVGRVLPALKQLSEREEESVRNVVAECMGKLVTTDPSLLVPQIVELCGARSSHSRWTGATSYKFALSSGGSNESEAVNRLFEDMSPLLQVLEDEDVHVRRAALLALTTAAHHHSHVLDHVRDRVIDVLVKAMGVKMERVVDLGPFKHKVDDGLPIRKAAYACIDTMLDTFYQQLDIAVFVPQLQLGLRDQDDIQLVCHQILIKACAVKPGAIVGMLGSIVEPLEKTVNKKVKEGQVGTEVDRVKDMIRSGLRAVEAIHNVRDTHSHPRFHALYENIKKNSQLSVLLDSVRKDRTI